MARRPWPDILPDVFRGSDAVTQGVVTHGQLRNRKRVVPVFHDVYRPASVPLTHPLRCHGAALVTPGAFLTGRSLATARGVELARAGDDVSMVAPEGAPSRRKGIDVREALAGPLAGGHWEGLPVTTPFRMGFDLAARESLEQAVANLDAVAHAGLLGLEPFGQWLSSRYEDDVRHAREALALTDARAESPPESVCRVRLVIAGFPVVPQVVVRDGRGFAARLDLGIEALRLGIEYDGAWHGDALQVARDRERLNRLREAGWVIIHVTAATLRERGALEALVWREVNLRRAA